MRFFYFSEVAQVYERKLVLEVFSTGAYDDSLLSIMLLRDNETLQTFLMFNSYNL